MPTPATLIVQADGTAIIESTGLPMPAQPDDKHVFDWTSHTWVDPRTLDDLKSDQWELMKAARETAEFGGFTWDGSDFDSDSESQRKIQGAVQMALIAAAASQPFSIDWTLADNTVRTLSGADMINVGLAMGTFVSGIYEQGRALREQIDAATTPEQVQAIAWSSISVSQS
jgi:hypothetical protein